MKDKKSVPTKDPAPAPAPEVKDKKPEPKPEPKKEKRKVDLDAKIKKIEASNMPEAQKVEYIAKLKGEAAESGDKVTFAAWANVRKIKESLRPGMLAFPKAKGVLRASMHEWDEIYKGF